MKIALGVKDQLCLIDLDEIERVETFCYLFNVRQEQSYQLSIADVSGRDEQELPRLLPQQKRVNEVGVFCHDHPLYA
jgi:hypothetical protein